MFGVDWDYYSSKLMAKQYKQNTPPESYKTVIKVLANPGLAYSLALNNPALRYEKTKTKFKLILKITVGYFPMWRQFGSTFVVGLC